MRGKAMKIPATNHAVSFSFGKLEAVIQLLPQLNSTGRRCLNGFTEQEDLDKDYTRKHPALLMGCLVRCQVALVLFFQHLVETRRHEKLIRDGFMTALT
jgi:hypothetical protein